MPKYLISKLLAFWIASSHYGSCWQWQLASFLAILSPAQALRYRRANSLAFLSPLVMPLPNGSLLSLTENALAVGLLVMMYPILCKIKYESLHHVFRARQIWIQIAFSVFLNWIIAPLLMVSQSTRSFSCWA